MAQGTGGEKGRREWGNANGVPNLRERDAGLFKYYQIRIRLRAGLSDPAAILPISDRRPLRFLCLSSPRERVNIKTKSGQSLRLSIARRESAGHLFFRATVEDGKERR